MTIWQRLYLWACERLYAELAWSYDLVSWLVSWGAWTQWRAAALTHIHGTRVLEIGFGTGTLLTTLAQQGYQVTGLELSAAMHVQTARKLARHHLAVPRVQAPTQQMPFVGGTFDTIISTFPSGYIVEPATLRECARLLRPPTAVSPGGRLVIVMGVANAQTPWGLLLQWIAPPSAAVDEQAERLRRHFTAAGLQAQFLAKRQATATVNLIIAAPLLDETPCQ